MRPFRVVALPPVFAQLADFVERREDPGIQNFGAIAAIEAFDVGAPIWLAWLDEREPNSARVAPRAHPF